MVKVQSSWFSKTSWLGKVDPRQKVDSKKLTAKVESDKNKLIGQSWLKKSDCKKLSKMISQILCFKGKIVFGS